jgi:hypothetical protein
MFFEAFEYTEKYALSLSFPPPLNHIILKVLCSVQSLEFSVWLLPLFFWHSSNLGCPSSNCLNRKLLSS